MNNKIKEIITMLKNKIFGIKNFPNNQDVKSNNIYNQDINTDNIYNQDANTNNIYNQNTKSNSISQLDTKNSLKQSNDQFVSQYKVNKKEKLYTKEYEVSDEQLKNLRKIQSFFEDDISIKKELYRLSSIASEVYNMDDAIQYQDEAFNLLNDFKEFLKQANSNFSLKYSNDLIEAKIKEMQEKLTNTRLNPESIKNINSELFSNINDKFVNDVNNNICGYTLEKNYSELFMKGHTVNELLHLTHHQVTNDDLIYSKLPLVKEEKLGEYGESIRLYKNPNEKSEMADLIFENIPNENTDVGTTDILSIDNDKKIIMMVRDKGHALSVQVDKNNDNGYCVDYFIPKICNVCKVNNLPGVNKVSIDTPVNGTTSGKFDVKNLSEFNKIIKFIKDVPTDSDIELSPIENTYSSNSDLER